jgi:leader peptidase (prepilin peptidase)/N-methyltransferase
MVSESLPAVFAFLVGLAVGSFLNVIIYRLPRGESIIRPRSRCPHCLSPIAWYDNIPLLSFVLLRGRCHSCGERISWRYPVVELLSGLLALGMVLRFGLRPESLIYYVFAASLLAASVIDLYHKIIPDQISLGGMVIGVLISLIPEFGIRFRESLLGAGGGFLSLFLVIEGYYLITRREGMGLGDAKILGMIGAFLGWRALPGVVLIGSLTGVLIGAYPVFIRGKGRLYRIPFGPFLSAGAVAWLFLGDMVQGQIRFLV